MVESIVDPTDLSSSNYFDFENAQTSNDAMLSSIQLIDELHKVF
jgi:hypothetical protein